MQFADIHIHALFGCDDGAKSPGDMKKMIEAAYVDGTRYMCLTPHYNPGYFGDNLKKSEESFKLLFEYTKKKYPQLKVALGNELRYNPGCEEWLSAGKCRCMNSSKYVLVDFFEEEEKKVIAKGIDNFLNSGYIPILAHAERYKKVRGDIDFLKELKYKGAYIQIDTRTVFGDFGFGSRRFCKKILRNHIADFVSSDAHGLKIRPPQMGKAFRYIAKRYGSQYAESICYKNAVNMIFDNLEGER